MATADPEFKPLTLSTMAPETRLVRPHFTAPGPVDISAYALEVMTDLRFVPTASIRPEEGLVMALQKMIARGVRLLLVAPDGGPLVGLLSARDIEGDRPVEVMDRLGVGYGRLTVAQVMTPAADIEALPLEEVLHARVGDIVATLKHSWRQHAVVVEEDAESGQPRLRGIFSASQIARQLGIAPDEEADLARTFAEIERAMRLSRPARDLTPEAAPKAAPALAAQLQ